MLVWTGCLQKFHAQDVSSIPRLYTSLYICPPQSEPPVLHAPQVCTKCQVEKAAEEFNRNKVRPDGLCSYCKVCNAAAAAERRRSRAPVTEPTVSHKVCPSIPSKTWSALHPQLVPPLVHTSSLLD